jgi:hypothetical protein
MPFAMPDCSLTSPYLLALLAMTSSEPTTPTSFPRFRQLPAELRVKIWQDALPPPRTIHLVREVDYSRMSPSSKVIPKRCAPTQPCPPDIFNLLRACSESRHEVLARYAALLVPREPIEPPLPVHYFDPRRDGIFIDQVWPWVRGALNKPSGVFKTRRLSINCNTWWDMWVHNSPQLFGRTGLVKFKHLEELNIVFRVLAEHEEAWLPFERGTHGRISGQQRASPSLLSKRQNDIEFPNRSVAIQAEPITQRLRLLKKANPDWNVPKLKLMAWATTPPAGCFRADVSDLRRSSW